LRFSFAALGLWRLTLLTLTLEIAHIVLVGHWPEISSHRYGPRPATARLFMGSELIALMMTLAVAIDTILALLKNPPRPVGKISAIALSAVALLSLFLVSVTFF
jgi:hypothetical protein